MSANTKIFVFKKKEIIYTLIFAALGIILAILLITMFRRDHAAVPSSAEVSPYVPGVYTSVLSLGGQSLEVEVCVDSDYIKSVRFVNLDETVSAMYPLMGPSMSTLAEQIVANQSTENISYAENSKYTCSGILNAVRAALDKARTTGR